MEVFKGISNTGDDFSDIVERKQVVVDVLLEVLVKVASLAKFKD